ncbi:MAG: peroxide stress protein YaaA [Sphingomonadales bacterium]|nr:peroxide stress protein YaaA [Sphingomonadales bacterium]
MQIILSPAKKLDFETEIVNSSNSQPKFLDETILLSKITKGLSTDDLKGLMGISDQLAELNHRRYQDFSTPFDLANARQAVFAFKGDAYQGLDADSLSADDLAYAQEHLNILSGYYGVLRPLDLMQAYRLEMGIKLKNRRGKNLYEFWQESLSKYLNKKTNDDDGILVNLASNEYSKAVNLKGFDGEVITPQFKEIKDGVPKMIGIFAKKARGMMTRYIIQNRLKTAESLKDFDLDGYGFNPALSDEKTFVFTRG